MNSAPTRPPADDAPALTLSTDELARELRVSPTTITRLDQSGKLPAAIRVGHAKRWLRPTIIAWIAHDCPNRRESAIVREPGPPSLIDFPRVWRLFGFALCKRTRERIFEPEYEDLVAQFRRAHEQQYRTRWARRSLNAAFAVRTAMMMARCFPLSAGAVALAATLRFVLPKLMYFAFRLLQ